MKTKIAINGFGRIGRTIVRTLISSGRDDFEIVAINDRSSPENAAHLLRYDSVHGRCSAPISIVDNILKVGAHNIKVSSSNNIEDLNWDGVDVLLECTGIFTNKSDAAKHIAGGAKKVLISAPGKGVDKTIVYGVNHQDLTSSDTVVSNASCTTNCLAPIIKVMDDAFGIKTGFMTTIHAYTKDQPTLDSAHSDWYRGRAAAMSMIPTSTGAARAISEVLPKLKGKLDGVAIRVPTPNVSCVDVCLLLDQNATVDEINSSIKHAVANAMKGIIDYVDAPLVSVDFNHDPHSAIFALDQTKVTSEGLYRILAWYDNEWGFSNRMLDTAKAMHLAK